MNLSSQCFITFISDSETDRNVEELFKEWQNPVFERAEQVLQTVELRGTRKAHRILNPCKFSKSMLQNLKVLLHVDDTRRPKTANFAQNR